MKIAQILRVRVPHPIALSVHAVEVCQAMADDGHRVTLFIPSGRPPDMTGELPDPYEYYGARRVFAIRAVPHIERRGFTRSYEALAALAARLGGFDLCYMNDCARAALYSCMLRVPTVYHAHQYPQNPRARAVVERLFRQNSLRRVVTNTEALAGMFRRDFRLRCDLRVAYNGVDLKTFGKLGRADARARLGLPEDRPIVTYLGHLYQGRGVEYLFEAAAHLPEARFLVVGGLEADVQRIRREWNGRLPANVSLPGFVPRQDVPAYLAAADVLAMPYTSKTLVYAGVETTAVMNPMKMFEYMATGRAIVGTKLPAVAEVLRDGETALLVEPDSAEALRAGIARLLADRPLAERLGKAAQAEAREHHSWTAHVHQILEGIS